MQEITNDFEIDYKYLIDRILTEGDFRTGRNGNVKSLFGVSLSFDLGGGFPIITGRKMFAKGVLGELAAMLRGPKHVSDFKDQGCNYWDQWADEDGFLKLDYGNAWLDFNGVNQLAMVIDKLKNDPHDRRMVISSWRPDGMEDLSLPCCHYAYQFYVRGGEYVDMVWTQRSADVMIGVPSDAIFAAAWLTAIGSETKLIPGRVTMNFGDAHVYEEHVGSAIEYMKSRIYSLPMYTHNQKMGYPTVDFVADDITLINYEHGPKLDFELKT